MGAELFHDDGQTDMKKLSHFLENNQKQKLELLLHSPNEFTQFSNKIFLFWWWLQGLPPEELDSGSQSKWEWPLNRSPDAHRASSPSEG
jgi:hypothetical protein